MNLRRHLYMVLALMAVSFLLPNDANGETVEQSSAYFSQTDDELTVRKVAILPASDNLGGIYARPIETHLTNLLKAYHQWDLVDATPSANVANVDELEENPDEVRKLGQNIDADAFLIAKASKGPNGLTIKLDLFLKNDGKLFAQEMLKDHPRFDLNDLKAQIQTLFSKLKHKIPYDGLILSRQGNRVTLNLGKADGIAQDQVVTVVQIIKIVRHPKFNFLVSTEKEILGKVKILKVDETLSFGAVISELDKGVIRRLHKISGLDQVAYAEPEDLGSSAVAGDSVMDRADAKMNFGRNPEEWRPVRPPSFGAAGIKLGFGNFDESLALRTQTLSTSASFYPSLGIFGELWINPNWTVRAELEQGIIQSSNPRTGSTPTKLNHAVSKYALALGYNFLLQEDFFGPKLQFRMGLMNYRVFVDDSSPVAFTTTNYSGFLVGIHGSLPISPKRDWYVGGGLNMVPFPSLHEKPVTSGASSKNTIVDFTLSADKKLSENLYATGSLDFSLYSTSFTGTGTRPSGEHATSLSQRHRVLSGGVKYMF